MKDFLKLKKNKEGDITGTKTSILIKLNKEIIATQTREGQKWINSYFGITEDSFLKSFFFRQKEYDELFRNDSSKRLQFIEEFIGASFFEKAKKFSAKRRNELDIEIKSIDMQVEELQKIILTNDDIKNLNKDIKNKELENSNIEKQIFELENEKEEIIQQTVKLEETRKKIDESNKLKKQLESIKFEGKKIENKNKEKKEYIKNKKLKIKELENQLSNFEINEIYEEEIKNLDSLKNSREKYLINIGINETELKELNKNSNVLEIGDCPSCFRPIDDSLMKILIQKNKDKINKIEKNINCNKEELNLIDAKIMLIEESFKERKQNIEKYKNIDHMLKIQNTELKSENSIIEAYNEQKESLKKQFNSTLNKYNELKDVKLPEVDIFSKRNNIDKKIKELKLNKEELIKESLNIKSKINLSNNNKEKLNILQKKRIFRVKEIKYRIKLDSIFDKCRMETISVGLKELENSSTEIISEIGATQKQIIWDTEKETLAGNIRNSLDIYLNDEKGKRLVQGLSGGERDLSAFSTRAALAKYKLSRMNSKIDFLILDEIFGSLDVGSREELITVVNMFKEEFSQVFVISHTDLKNNFGNNIKVEMGNDGITRLLERS